MTSRTVSLHDNRQFSRWQSQHPDPPRERQAATEKVSASPAANRLAGPSLDTHFFAASAPLWARRGGPARYLYDHTIELTTPCRQSKGCRLPPQTVARLLMEQAVRPVVDRPSAAKEWTAK